MSNTRYRESQLSLVVVMLWLIGCLPLEVLDVHACAHTYMLTNATFFPNLQYVLLGNRDIVMRMVRFTMIALLLIFFHIG